ncbi:MAG: hypothetical protein ACRD38_06910 [Nitrososphaerales archaeon]
MAKTSDSVRLPKKMLEELFKTSSEFTEVIERMEVLLDKETIERLKRGQKEYRAGKYTTATKTQVDKVLAD